MMCLHKHRSKVNMHVNELKDVRSPFVVERVITPRHLISAICDASIITPITDLNKSNARRRLRPCRENLDNL